MHPRTILRIEGLAVLVLVLAGYFALDGPLWLLAVLALAPDLSMLGYLGWSHRRGPTRRLRTQIRLGIQTDPPLDATSPS